MLHILQQNFNTHNHMILLDPKTVFMQDDSVSKETFLDIEMTFESEYKSFNICMQCFVSEKCFGFRSFRRNFHYNIIKNEE